MVPDSTLILLLVVYAACILLSGGVLYWNRNPEVIKKVARRASSLVLGLLSYPVVVVSIILTHVFVCIVDIARYTFGRVAGEKITRFTVKTTFD